MRRDRNNPRRQNPRGPSHYPRHHSPPRQTQSSDAERKFLAGTAIDPAPRIRFEDGSSELTMRALDLITPVGLGQRGLIVAPPGSGKTTFLKHICQAMAKAKPDIKLYCLLVDERPEEVTDFKRSVPAEVHASSTDESYEHHIEVAHKLMQKVYEEVSEGKDVMVLIDSLTRLSRVHNADSRSSGRTLSGGIGVRALEIPRRIFGSARNIENGGSLSILATILVDTGSRMDQVIFEEFKGTGNMEIFLSREISSQRIYPAVDIGKSGTRKEELLVEAEELGKAQKLRRMLLELNPVEATRTLVEALEKYPTNKELLNVPI